MAIILQKVLEIIQINETLTLNFHGKANILRLNSMFRFIARA